MCTFLLGAYTQAKTQWDGAFSRPLFLTWRAGLKFSHLDLIRSTWIRTVFTFKCIMKECIYIPLNMKLNQPILKQKSNFLQFIQFIPRQWTTTIQCQHVFVFSPFRFRKCGSRSLRGNNFWKQIFRWCMDPSRSGPYVWCLISCKSLLEISVDSKWCRLRGTLRKQESVCNLLDLLVSRTCLSCSSEFRFSLSKMAIPSRTHLQRENVK